METSSGSSTKKLTTCRERCRMETGEKRSQADAKTDKPRTQTLPGIKSQIQDQMVALQQKIQLLEYDHKTYQESAGDIINDNQETIKFLQNENKKLNQELAQEKQRRADREAKSGQVIVQLNESKLHGNIKRHNSLCHQVQVRIKRLEELESLLKQNTTAKQSNKSSQEVHTQHLLENKLGEARLKFQDVEHMNRVYSKITTHLEEDMSTFQPQIEQLETEILLFRNELKGLKIMNQNAVTSRDKAWAEYQNLKKEYRCKRNSREQILHDLTHQANERCHYEKTQTKSDVSIGDQAPIDAYKVPPAQEEEEKICTYEAALEKIKDATGAINKCEVLQHFINQVEIRQYLEKEKVMAETTLSELKGQQEKSNRVVQELKYSGEAKLQAKLSENLKILEQLQTQLQLESKKQEKFKMEAEKISRVLSKATSEVKRLAIRLQHIKVPTTSLPVKDISLDLHVLDLLAIIGQQLQNLLKQFEGEDIEEIFREMEDEEFLNTTERDLPASNLHISLLSPGKEDISDDEDSEEDCDVMTRESIKQISQQITMSKRRANLWCEKWVK